MAKHSVNVLVKARDEASSKFKVIAKSAGGVSLSFKKLATAAGVYFSGQAIKNFATSSLELFGRQEAAVNSLKYALILLDKQYESELTGHKQWAASIQQRTVHGDEAILELMKMGAAMGKMHGEELQGATKAAIGLATAYGLELPLAMRLVARARGGDTTSLKRYNISLGNTKTTQAKFNKLIEIGAKNFKLAEAEAKTYNGVIQSTGNVIGDVKEEIGGALAPVVMNSALRIKKWSEDNQASIGTWASRTVAGVTLVKDIFLDLVNFMKDDWRSGVTFVFDSFLTLLEAAFKSATQLAIAGGKGIWKAVKDSLQDNLTGDIVAQELFKQKGGKFQYFRFSNDGVENINVSGFQQSFWEGPKFVAPNQMKLWHEAEAESQKLMIEEKTRNLFSKGVFDTAFKPFENAMKNIKESMPPDLADKLKASYSKFQKRLDEINASSTSIPEEPGGTGGSGGDAPSFWVKVNQRLKARESRFLTHDTRAKEDPVAKNTLTMVGLLKQLVAERKAERASLKGMGIEEGKSKLAAINEKYRSAGRDLWASHKEQRNAARSLYAHSRMQEMDIPIERQTRYFTKYEAPQMMKQLSDGKVEQLLSQMLTFLKQQAQSQKLVAAATPALNIRNIR